MLEREWTDLSICLFCLFSPMLAPIHCKHVLASRFASIGHRTNGESRGCHVKALQGKASRLDIRLEASALKYALNVTESVPFTTDKQRLLAIRFNFLPSLGTFCGA